MGYEAKLPVRVTVTGAAGNIGYALLFRIAAGQMLGEDQPIILNLLEIPQSLASLRGVGMELEDCAFPLLQGITLTDDPVTAFGDTDYALLVGSRPRSKGMERQDLIYENAKIFASQGKIINENSSRDVRVLVVGNPANTNALIAAANAPDIKRKNFTSMSRLDHNRALARLGMKTGCQTADIRHMTVWGNHSLTQYPDISNALVNGIPAIDLVGEDWAHNEFIPAIQQRGATIIEARGLSSAASAADAAIDHMNNWILGCREDDWVSMGVPSDGSYGISEGLVFSHPVRCKNGEYEIVQGLDIDDFGQEKLRITEEELLKEREMVSDLF